MDADKNIDVEVEIDISKRFRFPQNIVKKKYEDKNLVIYSKGVLWLVLSDQELEVYEFFEKGNSIEEALSQYDEEIVLKTVSQIEAKRFETPVVNVVNDLNIYIYLTNNCNEHCKHCYMYAGDIHVNELSPELWESFLEVYSKYGGKGITFTGGEVTVYKGFKQILKKADELGLKITVLSNGIGWCDSDIKECSKYIDEIQISIDGYNPASYYFVRQYDGFSKAIHTALLFDKLGTRTAIAVTPLYEHLDDFVSNFEPFARRIISEYPRIFIRFNLELIEGREIKKDTINNEEYRTKIKALVERLYPNYYEEIFPLNFVGNKIKKNCGFGEIAIAANGDVYWCNRIFELTSLYNIQTTSFDKILESSERIQNLTDVDHSAICSQCEIRYICGGDCRLNYPEIKTAGLIPRKWENECPAGMKESLYKYMIACNEYFYSISEGCDC